MLGKNFCITPLKWLASVALCCVAFCFSDSARAQENNPAPVPEGSAAVIDGANITAQEVVNEMLAEFVTKEYPAEVNNCLNFLAIRSEYKKRGLKIQDEDINHYVDNLKRDRGLKEITPELKFEAETLAMAYALIKEVDKEKAVWKEAFNVSSWIVEYISKENAMVTDRFKLPEDVAATWRGEPISGLELVKTMWLLKRQTSINNALERVIERKIIARSAEAKALKNEELQTYFDKNKEKFNGYSIHVFRILIRYSTTIADRKEAEKMAEEKANRIINAFNTGADTFYNVAADVSDAPSRSKLGDEGWITKSTTRLPKETVEAAFKLRELNEISNTIKNDQGIDIILLADRRELPNVKLDNIREKVAEEILREKHLGVNKDQKALNIWIDGLKSNLKIVRDLDKAFKIK